MTEGKPDDIFMDGGYANHLKNALTKRKEYAGHAAGFRVEWPIRLGKAGTALARGLVVVTSNTGEFKRVSGLQLENWR